jgi:3-oxoacyl-[acyl-carrier protein] reductase
MFLLSGKTAVVTCGARGLGYAVAEQFVHEGARVVIGDVDAGPAQAAAAYIGAEGAAVGIRCDTRSTDDIDALITHAVDTWGRLDILLNNVEISSRAPMGTSCGSGQNVITTHLEGIWNGLHRGAAVMRDQGCGTIVNMSAIAGQLGMSEQRNYAAVSVGTVRMTKRVAKEVARSGVRVNAIQPGFIRTNSTEALSQRAWDAKLAEVPMGRPGEPCEVARAAVFLASHLSSYITGTVLEVTGGGHLYADPPLQPSV